MANEATPRYGPYEYQDYTVDSGTTIEKGTLLKLTDPRTVSASDGASDFLAGIAAVEKTSSDESTRLSVATRGTFDMIASGSIPVGSPVSSSATANHVTNASALSISGSQILGYALETASTGEVIQVKVTL